MSKLLDNKRLWRLAGEDPFIVGQCTQQLRKKFGGIGLLVLFISTISAVGVAYGVEQILNSTAADLILGLYFALFVFFLYLFVLYTLSRDVLPSKDVGLQGKIVSYLIRIGFLIMLGFLVAQPLNYLIFKKYVDNELIAYKKQELVDFNQNLNKKYASALKKKRKELSSNHLIFKEIEKNNRLKNRELRNLIQTQKSRNYFIRKALIQNTLFHISNSYKTEINKSLVFTTWMVTLFLITIFILPVLLKIFISISSEYYLIKQQIQRKLIDNHYAEFKKKYNSLFIQSFPEVNLSYPNNFSDPPYNTIPRKGPDHLNQEDFIKWLCDEGN